MERNVDSLTINPRKEIKTEAIFPLIKWHKIIRIKVEIKTKKRAMISVIIIKMENAEMAINVASSM